MPPQEGSAYEEIVEESDESEEELEELPPPVGPAALPQAICLSMCAARYLSENQLRRCAHRDMALKTLACVRVYTRMRADACACAGSARHQPQLWPGGECFESHDAFKLEQGQR